MNYIIVNSPDIDAFMSDINRWGSQGIDFVYDFISDFPDEDCPGGWGCAKFNYPAPSSKLFLTPSIEYRYNADQDVWTADGEPTQYSYMAYAAYRYFVEKYGDNQ